MKSCTVGLWMVIIAMMWMMMMIQSLVYPLNKGKNPVNVVSALLHMQRWASFSLEKSSFIYLFNFICFALAWYTMFASVQSVSRRVQSLPGAAGREAKGRRCSGRSCCSRGCVGQEEVKTCSVQQKPPFTPSEPLCIVTILMCVQLQ